MTEKPLPSYLKAMDWPQTSGADATGRPMLTEKQLARPLTLRHVEAMLDGVVPEFRLYVEAALKPLKARIAELEARPELKYSGTWQASRSYRVGEMITHSGSLWHCNRDAKGIEPGGDSLAWTLVAKRGRDGKDGDGTRITKSHR